MERSRGNNSKKVEPKTLIEGLSEVGFSERDLKAIEEQRSKNRAELKKLKNRG